MFIGGKLYQNEVSPISERFQYPYQSDLAICEINIIISFIDMENTNGIMSIISNNVPNLTPYSTKTILDNGGEINKLISFKYYAEIGSYTLVITALKNSKSFNITLPITCEEINTNDPNFKIDYYPLGITPTMTVINSPNYIIITGLKYRLKNLLLSGVLNSVLSVEPGTGNIFKIINSPTINNFGQILKYNISIYPTYLYPITVEQPINKFSNNIDNIFTLYPSTLVINDYCIGCSPIYTIKTKITDFDPFLLIDIKYSNGIMIQSIPKPAYKNDKEIYYIGKISSEYSNGINETKVSVYTQYGNTLTTLTPTNLILKSPKPYQFNSTSLYYRGILSKSYMFTNSFQSDGIQSYDSFNYSFSFSNSGVKLGAPFGLVQGNNLKFNYSVSFLQGKKNYKTTQSFTLGNSEISGYASTSFISCPLEPSLPNTITIQSFEVIPMFEQFYLVRIELTPTSMDIFSFFSFGDMYEIFGYETLTQANGLKVFEIKLDINKYSSFLLKIVDIYSRELYFSIDDYISTSPNFLTLSFPKSNIDINLIQDLHFLFNEIDVTNRSVSNKMFFTFPNLDLSNLPKIKLILVDPVSFDLSKSLDEISSKMFFAKYNTFSNLFEIEFNVPANTYPGILPWLLICDLELKSLSYANLPLPSQLIIKSSNYVGIGPIFSNIDRDLSGSSITWLVTIESNNGFDFGDIEVRGKVDESIYKYHLTPSGLISGNQFKGVYQIKVDLSSPCFNQIYTIGKVVLYDTQGLRTFYSKYNSNNQIYQTPFYNFLSGNQLPGLLEISSEFCGTFQDNSTFSLRYFNYSKTKTSTYYSIDFTIQIQHSSGLKDQQTPIVYLIAENFKTLECISNLVATVSTEIANYSCSIILPYGFGYNSDVLLSVYGFINNGGSYAGYSSNDLYFTYLHPYYITDFELLPRLEITSTSKISSSGGYLWISGREFLSSNTRVFIKYTDDKVDSFIEFDTLSSIFSSAILVGKVRETTQPFYIKVVLGDNSESNEYLVTPVVFDFNYVPPTPTPTSTPLITNAPQKCKGNPECGGPSKGYCSESSGCICFSPNIGVDCSNVVITVPQPNINNTSPSTEILETNQLLYRSLISIISIREFDINLKVVNEFKFDKWIYSELNSSTHEYNTNITMPSNDGSSTTITPIKVTLQWFKDETNITFANQELVMQPSTIKYTIELSNYKFINQLNTLQLVMSASFSSSKSNNICSAKEFGETSNGDNSNYLKIQIDNHSLYGRFIKRAIIDSKIKSIENTPLDSSLNAISSASSSQSFIGINLPWYENSIIIDPDFSVLLNPTSASNLENSICNNNSSKLTTTQLAGIIVGASVLFICIIGVLIFILIKKRKHTLMLLGIKEIVMKKQKK